MSVGKSVKHDSALAHVTGESIFIDDRPETRNEIHVGVVESKVAFGEVISIDATDALAHPDCLGVYTEKDFVHKNWGTVVHDQQFLAGTHVNYMAEPVALIASSSRYSVEAIKALVKVEIKELPGIFTIDEARKQKSLIYKAMTPFTQGNVDEALAEAPHNLTGTFTVGGQEHFYMESQAAVAYPLENGQIEVHSSSQHPSETQRVVAEALGLPLHHVTCVVKRMGGGFGGKESQAAPIAAYAALVAAKHKRPARVILSKDSDMKITGKRHPFQNEYTVGFDSTGKILGLKALLQSDGGAYTDLSWSILERAMFHLDGGYFLENVSVDAACYKTHNHSNTAFRGFGGPQGNMTIESVIEDIAQYLKIDSAKVREINLYRGNNIKTPYGQDLENNMLPAIFDSVMTSSEYEARKKEIEKHNAARRGTLRGLSITATKFGISFTARFLNQGNALVNLHLDGTVQVSTGATEMGQGVNTKIQQIVASAFGIEPLAVQIMPTSTEKNHNTSPTAASSGADINGSAALKAANKIKAALAKLAQKHFAGEISNGLKEHELTLSELSEEVPDTNYEFAGGTVTELSSKKVIKLKDLVSMAYLNRISLGAYAHYKISGLGFDKEKVQGKAFNYFTQGMAVSEVLIDEYTGEVKVQRVDILMDLGRMINPGIDRGQVAGAFVQGMGWVTTENLFYDSKRNLVSHSPTTYKIPNIQDTPRVFNIDFIENLETKNNVYGSKAVGEPPLLLGISVWTAVKNALSFRANGKVVQMTSPATSEVVLMELSRLKAL
jgi:xanthine dehydrogenase large subunit